MVRAIPVTPQPAPLLIRNQRPAGTATRQLAGAESDPSETLGGSPIGEAIINSSEAFGPGDVRTFYDETVGSGHDGTGDCIAIVGISDFLDSAMSAFTSQFGLPAISYTRETHGGNPGINSSGESEAELDLQWAHAAAPGASIVYHLGSNLVSDISGAVTDNQCGAISISYAFCSPSASLIENTLDPLFKQAAAQGQTVFVSSGDNGAAGQVISGGSCVAGSSQSVNEMSADPNVTSVGGTQFNPTYSAETTSATRPRRSGTMASAPAAEARANSSPSPAIKPASGVPADGARDVPDIALIASPEFPGVFWGHDVGGAGQITCCIGGTSLAAPIWAGFSRVIAQLAGNTRLGNLNPLIYSLANTQYDTAGFYDVTSGNNNFNGVTGFSAGPGYDQATGWGTIDFNVFANAAKNWLAASNTPTPTSTMTPSATATVTATFAATPTVAPTATISATLTPTAIVSQTPTPTNVATPKPTTIPTATATQLGTRTPTPTVAATSTPPMTATPTIAATSTPTVIVMPTPTATPTPISEPSGGTLSVPASVRFPAIGVGMKAAQRTILIANRSASTPLALDIGTLMSPFTVSGAGQFTVAASRQRPGDDRFHSGRDRDGQPDAGDQERRSEASARERDGQRHGATRSAFGAEPNHIDSEVGCRDNENGDAAEFWQGDALRYRRAVCPHLVLASAWWSDSVHPGAGQDAAGNHSVRSVGKQCRHRRSRDRHRAAAGNDHDPRDRDDALIGSFSTASSRLPDKR